MPLFWDPMPHFWDPLPTLEYPHDIISNHFSCDFFWILLIFLFFNQMFSNIGANMEIPLTVMNPTHPNASKLVQLSKAFQIYDLLTSMYVYSPKHYQYDNDATLNI